MLWRVSRSRNVTVTENEMKRKRKKKNKKRRNKKKKKQGGVCAARIQFSSQALASHLLVWPDFLFYFRVAVFDDDTTESYVGE